MTRTRMQTLGNSLAGLWWGELGVCKVFGTHGKRQIIIGAKCDGGLAFCVGGNSIRAIIEAMQQRRERLANR